MKFWWILVGIFLVLGNICIAQDVKEFTAVRTDNSPKIDGILNDRVWSEVKATSRFIEFKPVPGRIETENRRTEVKIVYDNTAIYIGARMYDEPDSIFRELMPRDNLANSDFLGIVFDTYLDRINAFGFYVSSTGTQFDAKYSNSGNEDNNWDAVWDSQVKIDSLGWTAELKIPYSALRFGSAEIQEWGLNMTRRRHMSNQQSSWSNIDPKISGFINQGGVLNGIKGIKSPIRLSFSPYISSTVNNYPHNQPGMKNTSSTFNGGMDIKYGISQSFTLDMTLVPDFGQIRSDNQVLNLSPFEVRFNENRQFFTEGTELFNKGNLFYSRRIGSNPAFIANINSKLLPGETIRENPSESKLLNATKISGRSENGLGLGFFNAVTKRGYATVENSLGEERLIETHPLSNYNILVLDQSLKNNSSVTFLNTNVLRQGSAYDANVSSFLANLNDRNNKYYISGAGKFSHVGAEVPGGSNSSGFNYELGAGKKSGNFTWGYDFNLTDNKFDPTDLGYFNNNNFISNSFDIGYNVYTPGKIFNRFNTYLGIFQTHRFMPRAFQSSRASAGGYFEFKNFWTLNVDFYRQFMGKDFYEPRVAGKEFNTPASTYANFRLRSNPIRKYNAGVFFSARLREQFHGVGYVTGFYQNFRVKNRLSLGVDFSTQPQYDYSAWLGISKAKEIIFSRFDRNTIESMFDATYTFNSNMGVMIRGRHYWSNRNNKAFYFLRDDGELQSHDGDEFKGTHTNYNVFNIDLVYSWRFAPGSELSVAYKNVSQEMEAENRLGYFQNFDRTLGLPQNNNVSLKILYYLDYLQLRRR
ncbi:Carbohydrate family 9 binding domain-like [Daejeonella rubra]|uniref:Carbohydrate family 9 binding domain-like n=1 Tax=Daejeonella rubra TaxID=990371 RepID=A0A1G9VMH4_9SPHI|nr:DUF5916 domain-containing protein [Daejeonella rubra]SDM73307.1 Carbohydrate family 9 binding domain-like [Daejeonella rubra]